eukprot:12933109-Ditylum_brightwellii.AAC.1
MLVSSTLALLGPSKYFMRNFCAEEWVSLKMDVRGSLLAWTYFASAVHSWEYISAMFVRPQPPIVQ